MAEVLLSVVDLSPGAQLAEALDVGLNKMDWLETSWSQALLLIHGELFTVRDKTVQVFSTFEKVGLYLLNKQYHGYS
jgi:hypothetical protein